MRFVQGSASEPLARIGRFVGDHRFRERERSEDDVQILTDADLDEKEVEIRAGRLFPHLTKRRSWKPLSPDRRSVMTRRLRVRRIVYAQESSDLTLTVTYSLDGAYPGLLSYEIWTRFALQDGFLALSGTDAAAVARLYEDLLAGLHLADSTQRVLRNAREEARQLGLEYVGTEHILLGLARECGGAAGEVLAHWGLDRERVLREVRKLVKTGSSAKAGLFSLSPSAGATLVFAIGLVRDRGQAAVEPAHLLLGLIENEGIAAKVITALGVTLASARSDVLDVLGADPPREAGE